MKSILYCAPLAAALLAAHAAHAQQNSERVPVPDGPWDYASVDTEHNRLLVARGDGVMAVDLKTNAVTPKFVEGQRVHQALALTGTGLALSTNGTTNSATLFDAATGAVKTTIPTGKKPDAAVWDPKAKRAYVMNGADGTVTIIDPAKMAVAGTVTVGGTLEYAAVGPDGHVHVNVEDKSEIATFDPKTGKVVRRVKLTGCEDPSGLALTTKGTLIAACANGVSKVVDAASGRVLADLKTGPRPDAVIYDAKRQRAYVPSGGDGMLTVIDTSAAIPRVTGGIPTQKGARTGAVDPVTGRVYLPAADMQAPAQAGGRAAPKPGSFVVLVVTP
jgi:YVTN family beta-propeller protein